MGDDRGTKSREDGKLLKRCRELKKGRVGDDRSGAAQSEQEQGVKNEAWRKKKDWK